MAESTSTITSVIEQLQRSNERAAADAARGAAKTHEEEQQLDEIKRLREDVQDQQKIAEETKATTQKMLGINEEELKERQGAVGHLDALNASQEALKKSIEEQGGIAEDNKEFNKRAIQIEQQALDLRARSADTPAARKQIAQEQAALNEKQSGLLASISEGIGGMRDKMKEKIKGAGKGIMTLLKGVVIGGMLLAVIAFLNSPYWEETKKIIVEDVLPAIMTFFTFLKDNWKPIAIAFGAIGAAIVAFKAVLIGAKIVGVIQGIVAGFVAVKAFFATTLLPAVTGFMVPLLPIIAIVAGIALVLGALWLAFKDAKKVFEETGSIGEALKVGISKFMGTILGFIPAMILKLVGWVAGLFGFDDFKKKVDAIDPIQWISDTIKGLFDKVQKWFTLLFTDPVGAIVSLVGGYLSIFTDFGGWVYRKALKPAIDWIGGLFGITDASGGLETWVGDKIKILKDFGGWVYEKAIKPVIDWIGGLFTWATPALEGGWTNLAAFVTGVWTKVKTWFTNLFSWASTEDDKDSFVVKTIKTAVDAVKTWLGNMFKFDSASDILATAFNVLTFLPNIIFTGLKLVTKWLLGLFGFDDAAEKLANADGWTIGSMIVGAFKAVRDWIADLFTWGETAGVTASGDFSLVQMIGEAITNIWDWFKNLFDIDVMAIAKKIPGVGKLLSWFSSDDDKPISAEALAEADAKANAEKAAEEKRKAEKKAAKEKAKNDRELAKRKGLAARREAVIAEKEEELKQSQLFIKTGGKEGKDTVTNVFGSDVEAEKKGVRGKELDIAKLIAANKKANEADTQFKAAVGVVPDMKKRVDTAPPAKQSDDIMLASESEEDFDVRLPSERATSEQKELDAMARSLGAKEYDTLGPKGQKKVRDKILAQKKEKLGPNKVGRNINLTSRRLSKPNDKRSGELREASLRKSAGSATAAAGILVNAPSSLVSQKKVNISQISKSYGHPNAVVEKVNVSN